jgi:diacylglycerol kinase
MIQNNSAVIYRQPLNKTFATAFNGIRYFFTTERNGKIQLAVAVFTILTGFYLHLSALNWMFVFSCIAAVIGFEIINCAWNIYATLYTKNIIRL